MDAGWQQGGDGPGGLSVFRRKPVDQIDAETVGRAAGDGLSRSLGLWQLTAIGIGGIIGAGIFALAGAVANGTAGPAVLISFLVAGVASAAAAFSYAEFAGLIPKAGSAYTYGYAVLGEIVGWFIGWDLLLEYTAIVSVVAIGISGYFGFLLEQFGVHLPAWMLGAPGTEPHGVPPGSAAGTGAGRRPRDRIGSALARPPSRRCRRSIDVRRTGRVPCCGMMRR